LQLYSSHLPLGVPNGPVIYFINLAPAIGIEDRVQKKGREATGDGRAPVSFGHSSFCLFLCENWHKKNIRGIAGERER
jgi:hypothetical protein